MDFIRQHIKDGRLGVSDPIILDYPNYSTAYGLKLLVKYGRPKDSTLVRTMGDYLLAQQFNEDRGIDSTHLAYGAWGFGETNLNIGRHGHVDLSHTRRILQALKASNHLSIKSKKQASRFLANVQKYNTPAYFDGGFFASSVTLRTNKADLIIVEKEDSLKQEYYSSYATATCDGLLALIALEDPILNPQIKKAEAWLIRNQELKYPQGIPHNTVEQWHEVMRFYHLSVRAEIFNTLQYKGDWQNEMIKILEAQQNKDGSFLNPMGAPNKEDDPLLATAFAIIAINNSAF